MLDHQKLVEQLDKVSKELCLKFAHQKDIAKKIWMTVEHEPSLAEKIKSKKWPFLVPHWDGLIGLAHNIETLFDAYTVMAVDGSQIYYDKHQGPACYLINIGSVLISYGSVKSTVLFSSQPFVMIGIDNQSGAQSVDIVNLQREEFELKIAVEKSLEYKKNNKDIPFVCLFDGTLIFSLKDGQSNADKENVLMNYLTYLDQLYINKILHAGYISFTRSKELVNVLKVVASLYDDKNLENSIFLDGLTDMDIVPYFLKPGERSIIFQSKSPASYLYPKQLKPYFLYIHIGFEVVRIEIPYWIASNLDYVDIICKTALDQAQKGRGYPICLFEAHEQAVVKSMDREFFYLMVQKMTQKYNGSYQASYKSMKKAQVPI